LKNPLLQFSTSASYSPGPYSLFLVGAVMFSLCLYIKRSSFHCIAVITKRIHDFININAFPICSLGRVMD